MKNEKEATPKLAKRKKSRWTRDDTELTLLGLPAAIWFAVFAYLPLFGLIVAFKDYRLQPGMGFWAACSPVIGPGSKTSPSF